ncbi:MAG: hypothetical protein ACC628_22430, partial [Pirellulaceae bacterium]
MEMKTRFGLLLTLLCCGSAVAGDAVLALTPHLGTTPALVVVVCGGNDEDLPAVAGLIERTPWTVFCQGTAAAPLAKIR